MEKLCLVKHYRWIQEVRNQMQSNAIHNSSLLIRISNGSHTHALVSRVSIILAFNCLYMPTGPSDDIYDKSEISHWLFPGWPHRLAGFSYPSQQGLKNQSRLCLRICQSSNYNADITGLAHRGLARLPVALRCLGASFYLQPVCMRLPLGFCQCES